MKPFALAVIAGVVAACIWKNFDNDAPRLPGAESTDTSRPSVGPLTPLQEALYPDDPRLAAVIPSFDPTPAPSGHGDATMNGTGSSASTWGTDYAPAFGEV